MKAAIFLFFILNIISCNRTDNSQNKMSFKDSVIKHYFSVIDSEDFYDTTNNNYKVLKAYINNNTSYFKKLNNDLQLQEKNLNEYSRLDTCIHLQKLAEMPVDEAYRFSHSQSFCYSHQRITISRKHDTVRLHYIEFTMPDDDGKVIKLIRNGKEIVFGSGCVVVKEVEKNLSMNVWAGLGERLYNADYWGLNPHYYASHTDGSFWQIEACRRNKWTMELEQTFSVSRHCSCNPVFEEIGRYLLKLSGEKTMCETFD